MAPPAVGGHGHDWVGMMERRRSNILQKYFIGNCSVTKLWNPMPISILLINRSKVKKQMAATNLILMRFMVFPIKKREDTNGKSCADLHQRQFGKKFQLIKIFIGWV